MTDCSVIRDLLPLYEDGVINPETSEIIKEHLNLCPECRGYYHHIKLVARAMQNQNARNGYRYSEVARRIRRRKIIEYAVGAALFNVACYAVIKLISQDSQNDKSRT